MFKLKKIVILISLFIASIKIFVINYIKSKIIAEYKKNENNKNIPINMVNLEKNIHISFEKCYISPDNSNKKIVHLIFTRFIMEFWKKNYFRNIIYKKEFILNGIRVMKKYLLPSLDNQICKKFIWVLMLGEKANITLIKNLLDFNYTFQYDIIFSTSVKKYVKNITKYFDVLISTLIDYDDQIYYDAVNDVRKAINIDRPMIIYGYTRGVYYYEDDKKYYHLYENFNNFGPMSIFHSLITVLDKVNDSYTIIDLKGHSICRKVLMKNFKSYGIKELNYDPAIFDSGEAKFVWVRQKFCGLYNKTRRIKNKLRAYNFNLSNFFGK